MPKQDVVSNQKKTSKNGKKQRPMYKEKQKKDYIEVDILNKIHLKNYFERLYIKETEYNKDIADMNDSELRDTFMSLKIRREESRRHLISLMRGYINWAQINGKTDNNSTINTITAESLNSANIITAKMIGSPEHLDSILENSMPKSDMDYLMPNRAVRDMLVFWLLYCGIELEDLCLLEKNDIDIVNKKVIVRNDKAYEVNHKVISLWKECCLSTFIERYRRNLKENRDKALNDITTQDIVDNNYLFRPVVTKNRQENGNDFFQSYGLANIVTKIIVQYNKNTKQKVKLSPQNIRSSGMFYQLFQLEKNGIEITPELIAEKLDLKFKNEPSSHAEYVIKTRAWVIDYEDWKRAFNYGIIEEE